MGMFGNNNNYGNNHYANNGARNSGNSNQNSNANQQNMMQSLMGGRKQNVGMTILFQLLGVLATAAFSIIRDFRVTIVWAGVVWAAGAFLSSAAGWAVVFAGLAMILGAAVSPVFVKRFGQKCEWMARLADFAPVIADAGRERRKKAHYEERMKAYEFMAHANIAPVEKLMELNADVKLADYGETVRLTISRGIPGINSSSINSHVREFQSVMNAVRTTPKELPFGGTEITMFRNDPMDISHPLTAPAKLEPTKMKVECAVDVFGLKQMISLGGAAGMVVGGEPGSGKSESVTTMLLSIIIDIENTSTFVIDGKGGTEWLPYAGVADEYVRGDENVEPVYNVVKKQFDLMNERLANLEHTLGSSNFWNVSAEKRKKAGVRLQLLIIDECQGLFEARKSATNDEKMMLAEIERMVTALVKRGRSVGFFTILMTQKPTSDSLPSPISSNCGLRFCFSVNTPQAEISVLGALPVNSEVESATKIPRSRPGCAIMATDTGQLKEVRFFYMDEDQKKKILADAAQRKKQLALAA